MARTGNTTTGNNGGNTGGTTGGTGGNTGGTGGGPSGPGGNTGGSGGTGGDEEAPAEIRAALVVIREPAAVRAEPMEAARAALAVAPFSKKDRDKKSFGV